MNTYTTYADGYLINGSYPECLDLITQLHSGFDLVVTDPPYGGIIKDKWDNEHKEQSSFANWLLSIISSFDSILSAGASVYFWGGIGTPNYRPLFEVLSRLEQETAFTFKNLITWGKKRAIGTKHNYLFCREDLVWLIKNGTSKVKGGIKPTTFNVPYLDTLRTCGSFNKNYQCKSTYLRRTNVWTDITEILRKKLVLCQKPVKLYEIPILTSSNEGNWILDPFAGSGTCAEACIKNGRKFVLVERDSATYEIAKQRIDALYDIG